MKIINLILTVSVILLGRNGQAQGFVNLDFENAVINTNGAPQGNVIANNAIPGWTAYGGGNPATYIWYNSVSLGDPAVNLERSFSKFIPVSQVQGNYYIYLQGQYNYGSPFTTNSAAIGQTGLIPLSAQSLIFWGNYDGMVSLGGQTLAYNQLATTANYNIYGADISTLSGQTGQLLFTAPYNHGGWIDNIQFSSSTVPEPSELALIALGTLLLGIRRWQNSSHGIV